MKLFTTKDQAFIDAINKRLAMKGDNITTDELCQCYNMINDYCKKDEYNERSFTPFFDRLKEFTPVDEYHKGKNGETYEKFIFYSHCNGKFITDYRIVIYS